MSKTECDKETKARDSSATFDPYSIIGKQFDRLTVVAFDHVEDHVTAGGHVVKYYWYKCRCSCGNEIVTTYHLLRRGKRRSCGCIKRELLVKRNTTHGLLKDPIARALYYNVYTQMIRRCYNKSSEYYDHYGGRGITICRKWYKPGSPDNSGFVAFYRWAIRNGYRYEPDKHGVNKWSIDRINTNGPYAPWNCRWTTRKVQANNKTNTKMMPDVDGTMITRGYFASKYGMNTSDIRSMLKEHHWSEAAILFKATHPELGLRKTTHNGQYTRYVDKEGFTVIIPSLELQREIYRRRHSTQHG